MNAASATATDTVPATLFVALELSRSTWVVALHSPVADKVSQHRLKGADTEGLLTLITRKRAQAEEKTGRPLHVACCFEAGYDGFWLHRWLCAHGWRTACSTQRTCWSIAGHDAPKRIGWMRPGCCGR